MKQEDVDIAQKSRHCVKIVTDISDNDNDSPIPDLHIRQPPITYKLPSVEVCKNFGNKLTKQELVNYMKKKVPLKRSFKIFRIWRKPNSLFQSFILEHDLNDKDMNLVLGTKSKENKKNRNIEDKESSFLVACSM